MTNKEGESLTWSLNKSTYETNSNTEEEGNNNLDEMNLEGIEFKTKRAVSTSLED